MGVGATSDTGPPANPAPLLPLFLVWVVGRASARRSPLDWAAFGFRHVGFRLTASRFVSGPSPFHGYESRAREVQTCTALISAFHPPAYDLPSIRVGLGVLFQDRRAGILLGVLYSATW